MHWENVRDVWILFSTSEEKHSLAIIGPYKMVTRDFKNKGWKCREFTKEELRRMSMDDMKRRAEDTVRKDLGLKSNP